jgi:hypothetical protein
MKSVVTWLQKLKSGKRPDKEGSRESREPGAAQLPPDRISAVLVIGSLALIFATIAMLTIADIRPDKDPIREPDTAALNARNMQQHLGGVRSELLRLDAAPMGITPNRVSSPPTQTAVIKGLPGSPYRPPPTGNPAPRPSDTEWDARERFTVNSQQWLRDSVPLRGAKRKGSRR